MKKENKLVNNFIIGTFVALYLLTSIVSTIHVIDFFELSNPRWIAITLAVGFEIGAAASLASIIVMEKMNKTLIWSLFIAITAMQINGNLYYAFINMEDYQSWAELFNLLEWEELSQKRLLAAVSGAILPLIALGFIKSLVDYIRPASAIIEHNTEDIINDESEMEDIINSESEMEDYPETMEEQSDESLLEDKEEPKEDLSDSIESVEVGGVDVDVIKDEVLEDKQAKENNTPKTERSEEERKVARRTGQDNKIKIYDHNTKRFK